jgi:hypothetical protein
VIYMGEGFLVTKYRLRGLRYYVTVGYSIDEVKTNPIQDTEIGLTYGIAPQTVGYTL